MKRLKVCLTGGIACGKSLLSRYLREAGVETLDADDLVHELLPEEERRRLAKIVFKDPQARKALEARLHPIVKERIHSWLEVDDGKMKIAVIPLLFEVHWEKEFDIICSVISEKAIQIERMMNSRGYSREEAEGRISAQMDLSLKAANSDYIIHNNGTAEELKRATSEFVSYLKEKTK